MTSDLRLLLRQVELKSVKGAVVQLFEIDYPAGARRVLAYEFVQADGTILFEGADFGPSPLHATDSDASLLSLLSFLSLKHGDTDSEYFERYTPAQEDWTHTSACESLSCDVSIAEESRGCACDYVWRNLDEWECEDAPTISTFAVIDHGADGSQYFPGCGVACTTYTHVATGAGDTAREALEDALEQMATGEPEAHASKLQERLMLEQLDNPDENCHANCGDDCHGADEAHDWHHYVSVRYNLKSEVS